MPGLSSVSSVISGSGAAAKVWQYDASPEGFVDQTTAFNNATANDVSFPATEAVGDAIIIGAAARFSAVRINVGTAGTVGTLAWEYWNGAAWAALSVIDGTSGFTAAGTNDVIWDLPSSWVKNTLSSFEAYYVRARVTGVYTVNPLLTQGWLAGAFLTDSIDLSGGVPAGIQMPTGFDGTTLTLQGSIDGKTYWPINNDGGSAVSLTVAASRFVTFRDSLYQSVKGIRYLKLVSGTVQTASRTFAIPLRFI